MTDLLGAPADTRAVVAELADTVVDLYRAFGKARARWLAAAEHDVEWSAHVLLRCVRDDGPLRAGALAELVQCDPSTVSRQVAALVRDGLLERRADPDDGRASLLATTSQAELLLAEHDHNRVSHVAELVGTWNVEDVAQFTALLQRFTAAYACENSATDRDAARAARAGSTN